MNMLITCTALLVAASCAGVAAGQTGGLPPTKTVRAPLTPAAQRLRAPEFALPDAEGRVARVVDFRGRVVLLDFWATTCGGCVEEIPAFIDIAKRYEPLGLATVGIAEDVAYANLKDATEAWSRVRPFIRDHQVPYRILMGDLDVTRRYEIQALPLTYLIDVEGRVAAVYRGVVDVADLTSHIQTLLGDRAR